MPILSQQVNKIFHQGKDPGNEIDIGVHFKNSSVITRKEGDYIREYAGKKNVFMGFESGKLFKKGDDNVFIGSHAGEVIKIR